MLLWNADRADKEFSLYIRKRDQKCMNPFCICGLNYIGAPIAQLECSHYYDRNVWIARFDPENCITLGRKCHQLWEDTKQGRYRDFMIRWLGRERYDALKKRVDDYKFKNIPQITNDGIIKKCREFMESLKK